MRLSFAFILIGLLGGAVRYWRWWPSHTTPYSIVSGFCVLCQQPLVLMGQRMAENNEMMKALHDRESVISLHSSLV
jgi:hypothetical protein